MSACVCAHGRCLEISLFHQIMKIFFIVFQKLFVLLSAFRSGQSLPGTDFCICCEERSRFFFLPTWIPSCLSTFCCRDCSFPQCPAVALHKSRTCVCVHLFLDCSSPLTCLSLPLCYLPSGWHETRGKSVHMETIPPLEYGLTTGVL